MNCGIIITIEMLEISNIEIIVITSDIHLGSLNKSLILPVIVQRAMAIIIEAKKSMIISFKPHMINIETINAAIDRKLVGFNLID